MFEKSPLTCSTGCVPQSESYTEVSITVYYKRHVGILLLLLCLFHYCTLKRDVITVNTVRGRDRIHERIIQAAKCRQT